MDVVTDPCYRRAMNSDMVLCSSTGPDNTMASDSSAGLSHQAVPCCLHVSRPTSLLENKLLPLPFLSHLSTTYLLIIMLHALNNS